MKLLSLILLSAILSACGPAPSEPDGVAMTFLKSLQDGDFSQALSLVDTESKPQLLSVESLSQGLSADQRNLVSGIGAGPITISKIVVNQTPAYVEYSIGGGPPEILELNKEANRWKVHFQARNIFP